MEDILPYDYYLFGIGIEAETFIINKLIEEYEPEIINHLSKKEGGDLILYGILTMKFKFCGNVDCPNWLITEIIYLSKITPVKLRILGNLICKYIMKEGDTQKIKFLKK